MTEMYKELLPIFCSYRRQGKGNRKSIKEGNWKIKSVFVEELVLADGMVLIADSEYTLQQKNLPTG